MWFTGLPASGKADVADAVYKKMAARSVKVERLDGSKVRSLFPDTGFSKEERDEHVKRVGFLASLLEGNGVVVVASFISPYREARSFIRGICKNFIEVHMSTPLEECEKRDQPSQMEH